jgi:hypothetical protein
MEHPNTQWTIVDDSRELAQLSRWSSAFDSYELVGMRASQVWADFYPAEVSSTDRPYPNVHLLFSGEKDGDEDYLEIVLIHCDHFSLKCALETFPCLFEGPFDSLKRIESVLDGHTVLRCARIMYRRAEKSLVARY